MFPSGGDDANTRLVVRVLSRLLTSASRTRLVPISLVLIIFGMVLLNYLSQLGLSETQKSLLQWVAIASIALPFISMLVAMLYNLLQEIQSLRRPPPGGQSPRAKRNRQGKR